MDELFICVRASDQECITSIFKTILTPFFLNSGMNENANE